MDQHTKNLLWEIGRQLDQGIFPNVKNGGIVLPSTPAVLPKDLGKEIQNARARRQEARSQRDVIGAQRTLGGSQGTSAGLGAPGAAASVIGPVVANTYAEALSGVSEAYPGMQVWKQEGGFWLYTESSLLPGSTLPVSFLTAVSTAKRAVKSWGYYCTAVGSKWIGPRHTNFPDGSICAYDLNDGTWVFGDPLANLLDIYTVWALRHLHYEIFGRWPGPQAVPLVYERILEFEDSELCGCGSNGKRYVDCCKNADLHSNVVREAIRFGEFSRWTIRQPPVQVSRFMCCRNQPPLLCDVIA